MRVAKLMLVLTTGPAAAAAQLTGGIGPVGQMSSIASNWRPSAQLESTLRFDSPFASLDAVGSLTRSAEGLRLHLLSARHLYVTPAVHGIRVVGSLEVENGVTLDPLRESSAHGTAAFSARRGNNGAWLGINVDDRSTASLRMGGWRQVGEWLNVALSSTLRRGTFTDSTPRFWTEWVKVDSTPSDSGWIPRWEERLFGDSSGIGRKVSWFETEAKIGGSLGRLAIDGVIGWRPAIDSSRHATWFRAIGTLAVARSVALSAGVGTTTRQLPYARSTGRYAMLAVRLAPAALVRPRETPEITPAASSFRVERTGDQYSVRVRLPRARVVELSGDFNGWQPVRLTQDINGVWVATLDLKPGAYRMNLRIDGEQWLPPPGLAAVDDEFNGKVGLVVIR